MSFIRRSLAGMFCRSEDHGLNNLYDDVHIKKEKRIYEMQKILIALSISAMVLFSSHAFAGEKATTEECIQKTHEAAAMINARGLAESIKLIGDPKGPFVWKD